MNDLRYALRSLRNSPGFAATVVAILALGIGANASVFGIVDTLLFRPPAHVRDPGTVKRVYFQETRPAGDRITPIMSFPVYRDFTEHARSIAHLAAISPEDVSVATGIGEGRPAKALLVTHTYFPLLGVPPAVGRFFGPDEDQPGAEPVVVISHGFWQRELGSDPGALGKQVRIGASLSTVIGVTPKDFSGVDLETVDLWLPMRQANPAPLDDRNSAWLRMIARLPPDLSAEVAALELTQVFRSVSRGAPAFGFRYDSSATVLLAPLHHARGPIPSQEAKVSVWLGAVAALLLLIVCANVANLLLAHATSRRHDVAVRLALGAGRSRVVRQVFVQTVVLALTGGLAAVLVAAWSRPVLQALLLRDVPVTGGGLDLRVLAFTAAVAMLAGGIAGIVPAIQASRPNVVSTLKSETRGASPRARTRTTLVVVQVALTLVLLAGAGLFIRSVQNIRGDLGFTAHKVIVGTMDELRRSGRPREAINDLYLRMVERLERLPGVERVAASMGHPLGSGFAFGLSVPGRDSIPNLGSGGPYVYAVTPDFFAALGSPILRGRGFTTADRRGAAPVAVINQTMARTLWPAEDPLGECIQVRDACYVVVGVTGDMRRGRVVEDAQMQYYVPLSQFDHTFPITAVFVRAAGNAEALIPAVAQEMRSAEPGLPHPLVRTLEQMADRSFRPWRLGARLFSLFGLLAVAVAAVGLYGLLAYAVAQRTHELGVRIALGAQRRQVVRLVVSQGLRVTALAIVIGAGGAYLAGRALSSWLYEVEPMDPVVFAAVALILLGVAVAASYFPARRAAKVDPMVALRYE